MHVNQQKRKEYHVKQQRTKKLLTSQGIGLDVEHLGPLLPPDRPNLAHPTRQIRAGARHGPSRELQAQRRVEGIVGVVHPVLDQLLRHLGRVARGAVRRGDGILQRPGVVQFLDLLHEEFVRVLDVQLESDGVQDDPLEEEDPLLELDELLRLAVEQTLPIVSAATALAAAGRGRSRRWGQSFAVPRTGREASDAADAWTLSGRPGLRRRPILQPVTFLNHHRQLFWTFLRLGRQQKTCHGHLEPIVLGEAVLGVEAVEEHHAGGDRDAGQLEEAAALLQEAAGPASLLPLLRRGYSILHNRGELRFVECPRHSRLRYWRGTARWRWGFGRGRARRWTRPTSRRRARWRGTSRMRLGHYGEGSVVHRGPTERPFRRYARVVLAGAAQKNEQDKNAKRTRGVTQTEIDDAHVLGMCQICSRISHCRRLFLASPENPQA